MDDTDRLVGAFDWERPQLFVADDAFGSTAYRPDAAEHWARELGPMLQALDERHWLTEVSGGTRWPAAPRSHPSKTSTLSLRSCWSSVRSRQAPSQASAALVREFLRSARCG
jgi:hypothetical protein